MINNNEEELINNNEEEWRELALRNWANSVSVAYEADERLGATNPSNPAVAELAAMRNSVSWRVTAPLRAIRKIL